MQSSQIQDGFSEMTDADLGRFLDNLTKYEIFDVDSDEVELSPDMYKTHQQLWLADATWRWWIHDFDTYAKILNFLYTIRDTCQSQLNAIAFRKYTLCVQFLEKKFPATPPNEEDWPARPRTPLRSLLRQFSFLFCI